MTHTRNEHTVLHITGWLFKTLKDIKFIYSNEESDDRCGKVSNLVYPSSTAPAAIKPSFLKQMEIHLYGSNDEHHAIQLHAALWEAEQECVIVTKESSKRSALATLLVPKWRVEFVNVAHQFVRAWIVNVVDGMAVTATSAARIFVGSAEACVNL